MIHANCPESTNLKSLHVLCGSVADLHPDWQPLHPREPWKQWETTSPCGSQPPMRSPSLFSHCHFRISTHSRNIPLGPPLYKHFITLLLLTFHHFVLMTDCIKSAMYQFADTVMWLCKYFLYKRPLSWIFLFKSSHFWKKPSLVWSLFPHPLCDQSDAANGQLPFRWMVLSALAPY